MAEASAFKVIGAFAYDATIDGLARGDARLTVVHSYGPSGWSTRTVLPGPWR
jgi:hypothetical protein